MGSQYKLTAKQERFVLLIVKGEAQSTAYEQAGYSCKTKGIAATSASTLMKNPNIIGRLSELQGMLAQKTIITLDGITEELLEIKRRAMEAKAFAPAVAAMVAVAKLHGFMVDRQEVSVMHRPAPLPTRVLELSEREWLEQFGAGNVKRLGDAAKLLNRK